MNYSTSAAGSVSVELQSEFGKPIEGFTLGDCGEIYGDEIERVVSWKGNSDLSKLAGTPVRLRFVIKDGDLYSIRFRPWRVELGNARPRHAGYSGPSTHTRSDSDSAWDRGSPRYGVGWFRKAQSRKITIIQTGPRICVWFSRLPASACVCVRLRSLA